jgi:hypothetical protein
MQVTSLLSQQEEHEHGPECGCGHDHEHSVVHLWQAVVGVVCVINAFIVDWLFEGYGTLASASAMIGAIVLIYPIIVTAVRDLRAGRLSINELVAIAVLAAFASGDYKAAGVVAFFMLTGELIETRTAEGARKSVESLIKLTPTKARRLLRMAAKRKCLPASSRWAMLSASAPATTWRRTVSLSPARAPSTRPPLPVSRSRWIKRTATKFSPALRILLACSKSKSAAPAPIPRWAACAN